MRQRGCWEGTGRLNKTRTEFRLSSVDSTEDTTHEQTPHPTFMTVPTPPGGEVDQSNTPPMRRSSTLLYPFVVCSDSPHGFPQ